MGSAFGSRLRMAVVASSVMVLLGACTETVNEGVTDYRKATISESSKQGSPTDISKKYALSDTTPFQGNDKVTINKGRRYYVSLLQAFVGPEARVGGTNWFHEHEQIALVLRVHDSNDRTRPGRLVFFTDDVKLGGQFLNFSNLLTVGPTEYQGGVVTIDVDEVHLRGSTSHIKDLLQELAEEPDCQIGHHAPGSGHDNCDDGPVAASDTAQSSLVGPDPAKRRTWQARERDLFNLIDTDGYSTRYTLTLLPSGGIEGLPYPRFEAGNYVLMRHDKRDNALEWNRLQLDNNTGRLVYAAPRGALVPPGQETARTTTTSDANGKLASRDPHSDADLAYQSRKDQFEASGRAALYQDKAGDYREQSYVTLQINALDDTGPVAPPRVRSVTQEKSIRTRTGKRSEAEQ